MLGGVLALAGCDAWTDPATRLAADIESQIGALEKREGGQAVISHLPARSRQCEGPYRVQIDRVGALIVWCKDQAGATLASGSTSYASRFIDTPRTFIVEKTAGSLLQIRVERRAGRAVVVDAQ